MDDQQLQVVIDQLDHAVARDAARVKLQQYGGGPHECHMVANREGYHRLGVEMLKAATARTVGDGAQRDTIPVDLDYLLVEDDDAILFNWFERREPDAPVPYSNSRLGAAMVALAVFALLGLTCIGGVTVARWIWPAWP